MDHVVNATIGNQSFKLASIHPDNEELMRRFGGVDNLPPGVRLPDLLQAWGNLYNEQFPAPSPQRLKAIRLDMYRWERAATLTTTSLLKRGARNCKSCRPVERLCTRRCAFDRARYVSDLDSLHFFLRTRFTTRNDHATNRRDEVAAGNFTIETSNALGNVGT